MKVKPQKIVKTCFQRGESSKTQALQLIPIRKLTKGNRGLTYNTCGPRNPNQWNPETTQNEVAHNLLIKNQRKITRIVNATGTVAPRIREEKKSL